MKSKYIPPPSNTPQRTIEHSVWCCGFSKFICFILNRAMWIGLFGGFCNVLGSRIKVFLRIWDFVFVCFFLFCQRGLLNLSILLGDFFFFQSWTQLCKKCYFISPPPPKVAFIHQSHTKHTQHSQPLRTIIKKENKREFNTQQFLKIHMFRYVRLWQNGCCQNLMLLLLRNCWTVLIRVRAECLCRILNSQTTPAPEVHMVV